MGSNIKILGICGSPVRGGNVEMVLREALLKARQRSGVNAEIITLADKNIGGCIHCNWCVRNQSKERFCFQEDGMEDVYPKILEADGIVIASPVHFGRISGLTANMMDRLRVFVHGSFYKGRMRNKIGGALVVGFYRGGGVETALISINSSFFALQMIVATSRLYQLGAACLSSAEGKGKVTKGIKAMAIEDEFGLASVDQLMDRIVELSSIMKVSERAQKSYLP